MLGQTAHKGYLASTGGLTFDGKPAPAWDALTPAIRCGWEAFAARVKFAGPGEKPEETVAAAYAVYSTALNGRTWNGKPIPAWSEIGDVKAHWRAARNAVRP